MKKYKITKKSVQFDALPFYWKPLKINEIDILPDTLPFELEFDESIGVFFQKSNHQNPILEKTYVLGSEISGLMDDTGIGSQYAKDYLAFLEYNNVFHHEPKLDILEIGCGTGFFLHLLKNKCNSVLGIEPGYKKLKKFDVDVIDDFFPNKRIQNKKFDLIIAYGVLEHISDPDFFLEEMKRYLTKNGKISLAVPDCKESVQNGDLSMLTHEHFSYFNEQSLKSYLCFKGFEIEKLIQSNYGGSLYCIIKKGNKIKTSRCHTNYFIKLMENLNKFKTFLKKCENKSIGIYVPNRAINMLYLFLDVIKKNGIHMRFIDDSHKLKNKFLPCFNIPIENLESLKQNPPDLILIFSYSFGEKIKNKIVNMEIDSKIIPISEIEKMDGA